MGKGTQTERSTATWDDIDSGVKDVQMKRVVYQLLDSEGGSSEPGGRKVVAFILKTGLQLGSDGRPKRSSKGQILDLIWFVNFDGDVVVKEASLDSSREPGTFDTVQPLDAVV